MLNHKLYFAYGSNLNVRQMQWRCPHAYVFGTGYLHNYQLLFKGSKSGSYLTVEKSKGNKVPIGIWMIDQFDEKSLDAYEGYPSFYYKKELTVDDVVCDYADIKTVSGLIYIMHEHRQLAKPSWHYMDTCLEGYENMNFDMDYLYNAYVDSVKNIKEAV